MKIKHFVLLVALLSTSSPVSAEKITAEINAGDRVSLKVTVYNDNLGLIEDTRKVKLPSGNGWIRFMDVASHIIPASVYAKSLNFPDEFTVLEQQYEYDLISEDRLLDKYIGKRIKIVKFNDYQDRKEVIDATLLSNSQGPIYKISNKIYLGYPGYKVLPRIPEDIVLQPTLTWFYTNNSTETHNLKVTYLTNNISWKADYVVIINKEDTSSDITGWVTLDNKSGVAFKNAALKLVAGQVHRVEEERTPGRAYGIMEADSARHTQFKEKGLGEYHVYDLKREVTIKDKQTKQVGLLEATGIDIQKELITRGVKRYFMQRYRGRESKQPVNVYIKFRNSEANNLGLPLPAGVMRLYEKDDDESLLFIGEDRIGHTPKNEEIKLKIGEAFDVVVSRVQTDYHKISTKVHASEWEITVKNRKDKDVTVGIIESFYDNWEIVSKSHPYEEIDAFTIRFDVIIPKDKEVKVKYRVKIGL